MRQNTGGTERHGEAICRIWSNFAGHMLDNYHPQTADVLELFSREVQSQSCLEAHDPLSTEPQLMLAMMYLRDGNPSQAVSVLEDVVKIRASLDEARHARQVSQHALACAYLEEWRVSEAVEIFEHLVHVTKKEPAADLPLGVMFQQDLASAYLKDGRLSQAIEILEHVVQIGEKLVVDHPGRLTSQHVLAHAYLEAGRISRAIEILENVVQVEGAKLAADDRVRLLSQHELANAYLADGRVSRAIDLFEHVVRMQATMVASHPERLASEHELARAYWCDGRFAEADKLMSHVVGVKQRTLREGHRDRTVSEEVLAMIRGVVPENAAAVSKYLTASAEQQPGDHAINVLATRRSEWMLSREAAQRPRRVTASAIVLGRSIQRMRQGAKKMAGLWSAT